MVSPTMGQLDPQAGVMGQQPQPSIILEAGQFSSINETVITQPQCDVRDRNLLLDKV